MRPESGRTQYTPGLRRRDWVGIVLLLIPIAIYLVGALVDVGELTSPHVSWNVVQVAAVIMHIPLWVTAVILFISGKVHPRERTTDETRQDQTHP